MALLERYLHIVSTARCDGARSFCPSGLKVDVYIRIKSYMAQPPNALELAVVGGFRFGCLVQGLKR